MQYRKNSSLHRISETCTILSTVVDMDSDSDPPVTQTEKKTLISYDNETRQDHEIKI